jgi:hypothetical protein
MKNYFFCLSFLLAGVSCVNSFDNKVKLSVEKQLNYYPELRLPDLYKNFFQDRFGPGHLIADTAMAAQYLQYELSEYTDSGSPMLEAIGWEGNYYRVSLEILNNGSVPFRVYLNAFVESANTAREVPPEEWKKEWRRIVKVIDRLDLQLPDYDQDKATIEEALATGKYAMHHSRHFNQSYNPHYRIISKTIYEKKIASLYRKKD